MPHARKRRRDARPHLLDRSTNVRRGISLLRDERGSELVEYALVLGLFAVICIVIVQATAATANNRVETDETNYTNAFVNGY